MRKLHFRILEYFAAKPLSITLDLEMKKAGYRILFRGIPQKKGIINLQEAGDVILRSTQNLPLVSCLLVTKNRFDLAKQAVACFVEQTYPNRELIILDDGQDDHLYQWVKALKHPKILFFRLPDESIKLGELRNLSRQYASGDYIAQWDDDDISHPNRLLFQMALILKFELDGCTLQREALYFPAKNWRGWSIRRFWEGSMIASTEKLPLYLETRKGEETDAVKRVALKGRVCLLDAPSLYTYCFHGKNTFEMTHFEKLKA